MRAGNGKYNISHQNYIEPRLDVYDSEEEGVMQEIFIYCRNVSHTGAGNEWVKDGEKRFHLAP